MKSTLITLFLVSITFHTFSQKSLKVIKDLSKGEIVQSGLSASQYRKDLIEINGKVLFTTRDSLLGIEPWITDGTESGTYVLKDINDTILNTQQGNFAAGSNPKNFTKVGNKVFFIARDKSFQEKLWSTDGSTAGTVLIDELPGSVSNTISVGNKLILFLSIFQVGGPEYKLYVADAVNGISFLKDINSGGSNLVKHFTKHNNKVYFVEGRDKLWETDGTTSGTQLKYSFSSSAVKTMQSSGGKLYLGAESASSNQLQLWTSNGSSNGTQLIKTFPGPVIDPNGYYMVPNYFKALPNGEVCFLVNDQSSTQLWKTDGTSSGTTSITNLTNSVAAINSNFSENEPDFFTPSNQMLYYRDSQKLWRTDGTASGTAKVSNNLIFPSGFGNPTAPRSYYMVDYNNELFFSAASLVGDSITSKLYKVDKNQSMPVLVNSMVMLESEEANGELIMIANEAKTGEELWKTDGSSAGTILVKDFAPNLPESSNPTIEFTFGQYAAFKQADKMWVTDGTNKATVKLSDIESNISFSLGNTLYFGNRDTLYSSDGTLSGTSLAFTIQSGNLGFTKGSSANNLYFYEAQSNSSGRTDLLYVTDGTQTGTRQVKELYPSAGGFITANSFHKFGNKVIFYANNPNGNRDIWVSDGTNTGTNKLNLNDFIAATYLQGITFNNEFYFAARTASTPMGIWKTDGTPSGTAFVTSKTELFYQPVEFQGEIYFVGEDNANGKELWKTDGTDGGTVLVKDIYPGSTGNSYIENLTVYRNKLFFTANSLNEGTELWESDGTPGGTQLLKDICANVPGLESSDPQDFVVVDDTLFFVAKDQTHGRELWKTDGTPSGTVIRADLLKGTSSNPRQLIKLDSSLVFVAQSPIYGNELWRLGTCLPDTYQDTIEACETYTWIDGNTYTNNTNTPTFSLTDQFGCDSIVQLDLTILGPTYGTDFHTECESLTWLDGNTYTTSTTSPTTILTNSKGCDSIVNLDLTILGPTFSTEYDTSCTAYTWRDGKTYVNSTTTPTITLTNSQGCDSIINLNLKYEGITSTQTEFACRRFTWINGQTYTTSTDTPKVIYPTPNGCDSAVVLDLTILPDVTTYINNNTIYANASGAKYQWLDCNAFYQPIENDTNQSFVIQENGAYAVEVNVNGCIDTSACVVTSVSLEEKPKTLSKINFFPNPVRNRLILECGDIVLDHIQLFDSNGRLIREFRSHQNYIELSQYPEGTYFLRLTDNNASKVERFIIMR
ncbi:MAG: T9SS type A sorting domain-containing protein [Vicingaceae bacterium]